MARMDLRLLFMVLVLLSLVFIAILTFSPFISSLATYPLVFINYFPYFIFVYLKFYLYLLLYFYCSNSQLVLSLMFYFLFQFLCQFLFQILFLLMSQFSYFIKLIYSILALIYFWQVNFTLIQFQFIFFYFTVTLKYSIFVPI